MSDKGNIQVQSYNTDIPQLPNFEELFPNVQEEINENDKMRQAEKCGEVINEILNKYKCVFIPQANFSIDAQGYLLYRYNLQLAPVEDI